MMSRLSAIRSRHLGVDFGVLRIDELAARQRNQHGRVLPVTTILVAELLDLHYDPMYARSIDRNFTRIAEAPAVAPEATDRDFRALARELDAQDRLHDTA